MGVKSFGSFRRSLDCKRMGRSGGFFLLEGEWWVGDCLYRDILYNDVLGGGLGALVYMSG